MPFRDESQIDSENETFFNCLLDRFEKIWCTCFAGKDLGISRSAAFTAFVNVDQTAQLINYFEATDNQPSTDDNEDGEEWKTK